MVDRKYLGKLYPQFSFTVEQSKLQEFLLAIGDANPDFFKPRAVVPPTFATIFSLWGLGGLKKALDDIGVDWRNILHAEQEFEILKPVCVGDTVIGQTRVNDIYTRRMGQGDLDFVEFVVEYCDQESNPVLRDRALIIVRNQGESV